MSEIYKYKVLSICAEIAGKTTKEIDLLYEKMTTAQSFNDYEIDWDRSLGLDYIIEQEEKANRDPRVVAKAILHDLRQNGLIE
ncbi:MAG: hypothetical protein JSV25_07745 [Spirochaetota bacterium]|nr:MAG: hypothetical protein JSV25_07745 [Spirochaetota bacterium]